MSGRSLAQALDVSLANIQVHDWSRIRNIIEGSLASVRLHRGVELSLSAIDEWRLVLEDSTPLLQSNQGIVMLTRELEEPRQLFSHIWMSQSRAMMRRNSPYLD